MLKKLMEILENIYRMSDKISVLHGKMSNKEKDEIVEKFLKKE